MRCIFFPPSVLKLDTADLNITLRLRLEPSHNGDVRIASALGQIKLKKNLGRPGLNFNVNN